MDDGRCAEILDNGAPCGGYAVRNSIFCFAHDPKSKQSRDEARAAGGRAAKKAKEEQAFMRKVVGAAQVLPLFQTDDDDLELDTFGGLRTFAVAQVQKLRLEMGDSNRRGDELRRWMNFLLDLSKAEGALLSKSGGLYDGDGRADTSPEPNTLAWLQRIARGPAEGIEGSSPV